MVELKQKAVVVCPGRGTYNPPELGYLGRNLENKSLIEAIEQYRKAAGKPGVLELDSKARYQPALHTAGEHASALIYACSLADFAAIDRQKTDIVAITGNSMGWYTTLSLAGALSTQQGIALIDTMGSMMKDGVIGGQLLYPVVDENWRYDAGLAARLYDAIDHINAETPDSLYPSIKLGGYRVVGGSQTGLTSLVDMLEPIDGRYPLLLPNHAAFHTPLLQSISDKAKQDISASVFNQPQIPMVDGRGHIWQPYSTDTEALWDYTLGHQVIKPYDYSLAVEVTIKEFAPDVIILLGPGSTLGGATAQCLIQHQWRGLQNKQDFVAQQASEPFLLSMGMDEQRNRII